MAKKRFYAVQQGVNPGVYDTWDECKAQVDGFSGAKYKSFATREDAQSFVDNVDNIVDKTNEDVFDDGKKSAQGYRSLTIPDGSYAFVDGSFNPDTGVYGYGGFLCVGNEKHALMGSDNRPEMASMRNVAGEISGAMAAVKKAEELGIRELTIFYDYNGIEQWATGGWKTNKEATREYARFMNPDNRNVKLNFQHVKGHTGIEGNELADVMAKTAVGISLTKEQKNLYDSVKGDCKHHDFSSTQIKQHIRRLPSGVEDIIKKCQQEDDIQFD